MQDVETKLWGYIGADGKIKIPLRFANAEYFCNDYAIVAIYLPDNRHDWQKLLDIY